MKKSFSTLLFTLVVLAVQAKEIKPQDETIADTYWRNEATGDWFVGFTITGSVLLIIFSH